MFVSKPSTNFLGRFIRNKKLPISWIESRVFGRRSFKKYPLLSALHRATDGALIGIIFAVSIMSFIALHAQYLWTSSFSRLEITRDLNRRLLESTAVIESSFSDSLALPTEMVPTKAEDLIYIDAPSTLSRKNKINSRQGVYIKKLISLPITHGY